MIGPALCLVKLLAGVHESCQVVPKMQGPERRLDEVTASRLSLPRQPALEYTHSEVKYRQL